ncbi:MAG: hypothetical protein M1833_003143 [Piccolia ochrophora]|nr:MAG: hypothetical protein M1833_003143 [Piccolia ochrophora]
MAEGTKIQRDVGERNNSSIGRWYNSSRPPTTTPRGSTSSKSDDSVDEKQRPEKWSMGILNDKVTEEVPGTILLLSAERNEPLGLRNVPARASASSLPSPYLPSRSPSQHLPKEKKRTADGQIILDPQPDDSLNDPLNWPAWRRDTALLSLGFYCMVGGGMTPILAAGFNDVADTYGVSTSEVALTTGLYMMGLGIGSVIGSPTAILYGKRPVYLAGIILFCASSVWCAASPSYSSLVVARIVQGIAVSPCESLPSATIAEIFFLHERAYRVGVYTLLLLGGKNLVPLVSAVIIQSLGWRWVFWIVAMLVGFCFALLFFFVPETFWDRTPRPKTRESHLTAKAMSSLFHHGHHSHHRHEKSNKTLPSENDESQPNPAVSLSTDAAVVPGTTAHKRRQENAHVEWVADEKSDSGAKRKTAEPEWPLTNISTSLNGKSEDGLDYQQTDANQESSSNDNKVSRTHDLDVEQHATGRCADDISEPPTTPRSNIRLSTSEALAAARYTTLLRSQPPRTFTQSLRPWNGRLRSDNWFHVALRPFILFAYPSVLWSTLIYSLSIGWLIVLSESVAHIYRDRETYNFDALQTGLVYLSPFVGGVLGTAVAGKVSDVIVRFMSRRNGGVYEPEFRLVMALPVVITTCIGLMGFGWSAEEHDRWIVPTLFFGVISFGCSLGSTTAITFCVDSYRQYAGEALVTLNFSKNIFHGLVFSLFFNRWLEADGSKTVFLALGGIQLACLLFTVPMYIYGKRARMWTVRRDMMGRF